MIFRQLFDPTSFTYTYLISSGIGREALIIDQVIENTDEYINVLKNLELKLVKVIDTHIHADHISGLNELSKKDLNYWSKCFLGKILIFGHLKYDKNLERYSRQIILKN